ncbi:hypothetical protein PS874_04491 [Pseudomonas fluorescens]|nr:hypothetical protein PS874_04491 [Pseudomonas fluorescens]
MAALLANAQAASNHAIEIIFSTRPETPENFSRLFDKNIKLTNVQMNSLKEKLLSIYKIRKILSNSKPDQIFMHSSFAGFLGRIAGLNILHASRFFYIPHCIAFMRKDVGPLKRIIFILFEWIASIKKADYIACSESERSAITTNIPFRKCHMVENAINLNRPPVDNEQVNLHNKIIVITVGQIRPQKGPLQFALIAAALKKINPAIEFVWVGDGEPLARQQLLNAGVNVVGWIPKDDVWQYLKKSTIYLSTAKWEGMPVSVIEANIAGLPVVASHCAGNIDVIEHNKTGWLFKTTDEAVQQILFALKHAELTADLAQRTANIARTRFSVERYVNDMNSLI